MNKMQGVRNWKFTFIILISLSSVWVSCTNSNSNINIYKPELNTLADISREANVLSNMLEKSAQLIDTTTNNETFKSAKRQFDLAKEGYNYVLNNAIERQSKETISIKENSRLSTLCDSLNARENEINDLAFIYDQVEKESIDLLTNFNMLKNLLGISNANKFDIYSSFGVIDSKVDNYELIKKSFDALNKISNKDDIRYYSQNINSYQVVFICANLENLITIRKFVEKSSDLYSKRKNSSYVKANKSNLQEIIKDYSRIGNRKELCEIYFPIERNTLGDLEKFAYSLNR